MGRLQCRTIRYMAAPCNRRYEKNAFSYADFAQEKKSGNTGPGEEKKKSNKKLILIILLLLLLIGLVTGILLYVLREDPRNPLARDEDALGGMLAGKSDEEISQLLQDKVDEGMVNLSISAEPVFELNGKKGLLGIENLETNRYSFQVTVVVDGDIGTVYESGLLDPGYYIEYVELNQTLEEGVYPATAIFTTYSLGETDEPIAQANVEINLHILDGTYY